MDHLFGTMRQLQFDHTYLVIVISVAGVSVLLLHCAEVWGTARARKRTERAIAQLTGHEPPEGRT